MNPIEIVFSVIGFGLGEYSSHDETVSAETLWPAISTLLSPDEIDILTGYVDIDMPIDNDVIADMLKEVTPSSDNVIVDGPCSGPIDVVINLTMQALDRSDIDGKMLPMSYLTALRGHELLSVPQH